MVEGFDKKISKLNGKKILITGADGMLGSSFEEIIKKYIQNCDITSTSKKEMDVTDMKEVLSYAENKIDIIIHCAAKVNADFCEKYPKESFREIVSGTNNIISLAQKTNAKLFYPQSFLIFDGKSLPIDEGTAPNPLSKYGKDKLLAEKNVLANLSNSLIVRMGGFFGGYKKDKNFVGKIVPHISKLIQTGKETLEIGNRVWQPTYTNDLAYNCLVLLADDKNGVYNMASHGKASFYELTLKIISLLKIEREINIVPVSSSKFSKKENAKRPEIAIMDNKKLKQESIDFQRDWEHGLKEYLSHRYFRDMF